MRIALDAMGGDNAPAVNVEGAVNAALELDCEIILVGDEPSIRQSLGRFKYDRDKISIRHSSEVIKMDELPAAACRQKKDASVVVCASLVAKGEAEAMISAGNSGAAMASALLNMGRLKGVARPAIATVMPTVESACIVIDSGANVDCKPKHLLQFALMGGVYADILLGRKNPSVGILSIGEEDSKGNELTIQAGELLKGSGLNFSGNIEGRDIPAGKTDVVVCDGFVGNVVLKLSEGLAQTVMQLMKNEIKKSVIMKLGALLIKRALKKIKKKMDYAEYGGAPLLGVDGICIICHGGSNSKAIKNAVRLAYNFVDKKLNEQISEKIKTLHAEENEEKVLANGRY